jgi:hypothetical protein
VSVVNIVLWVGGIALTAFGYSRFRGPYARYGALKDQDANESRYNAWRGGAHASGTTGASVAMEILRRQWQTAAAMIAVGIALVVVGFVVK